jgi:DNA polymerase-3 subunit delta
MQLKADALAGHLESRLKKGALARVYTVSGDEPLLAIEAADAIRAAARRAGFTERDVLHADSRYDWSQLTGAAAGLSLFATKRIVEIRLPSGKPGREGPQALRVHAEHAGDDVLTLVTLPRLDKRVRQSDWAQALDAAGVWVDVPKIERAELPAWIGVRLARQQQRAPRNALEFIADRVEGNLLAAHQEIAKLGLLHPAGELTLEQVTDSVLNVARFDVFALPQAMLAGEGARAVRMLEGLRAEGEALPLILWTVAEEVRTLLRMRSALDDGTPPGVLRNELRLWGPRERLVPQAAQRLTKSRLAELLARCAEIDRLVKGLRAPQRDSNAWLELADIALEVAGAS